MNKNTLVALGVFVALAVAAVWSTGRKSERGISRVSFASVDSDAITRVEMTGKNAVALEKKGEDWTVAPKGKKADANAVKRLVESIEKINTSDLVSKDSARFEEFEVDAEKGTRIQASAGAKVVADFVIGKSARGGAHVKVQDSVYLAKGVFPGTFSRAKSGWLEKRLFDAKLEDIGRVEVTLPGGTPYALAKTGTDWAVEDASALPPGFRFDKNQARSLASTLVNLRAKDILDADPGKDVTKLDGTMGKLAAVIPGADGGPAKKLEIWLGTAQGEDKSVYAQVVGSEDVVTLHESHARNLRKSATDFRDLKMMTVEQDTVTHLEIVSGKMKLSFKKQGADWVLDQSSAKVPGDFELDPTKVTRRLSAVANARGTHLAEGVSRTAAGLNQAATSVFLTTADGKKASLVFGKDTKHEDRDMVYASGNADDAVYMVTPHVRKNISGALESFKKTAAPSGPGGPGGALSNLDPKALQGLPPDVRKSLEQQMAQQQQQQKMLEQLKAKSGK